MGRSLEGQTLPQCYRRETDTAGFTGTPRSPGILHESVAEAKRYFWGVTGRQRRGLPAHALGQFAGGAMAAGVGARLRRSNTSEPLGNSNSFSSGSPRTKQPSLKTRETATARAPEPNRAGPGGAQLCDRGTVGSSAVARFRGEGGMCYNRRAVRDAGKQEMTPREVRGAAEARSEGTSRAARPASGEQEDASRYCPVCAERLESRRCKLICGTCGYYMSCADYY
jgi:hypothetical protein